MTKSKYMLNNANKPVVLKLIYFYYGLYFKFMDKYATVPTILFSIKIEVYFRMSIKFFKFYKRFNILYELHVFTNSYLDPGRWMRTL